MPEQLAREIVDTARKMEEEEKKRQVFAQLSYRKCDSTWQLKLPNSICNEVYYVSDALNKLSDNGFVVDFKEVKAWVERVENGKQDGRMLFCSVKWD